MEQHSTSFGDHRTLTDITVCESAIGSPTDSANSTIMADESEDIEASTASSAFTSTPAPQLLNVGPKDIYFPRTYPREHVR